MKEANTKDPTPKDEEVEEVMEGGAWRRTGAW